LRRTSAAASWSTSTLLGVLNLNAITTLSASPEERFNATLKLAQLPRNVVEDAYSQPLQRDGPSARYYRKLGMSRIALRELGLRGDVPGLVKSSW
jgi:small subunit ribosomal protein S14